MIYRLLRIYGKQLILLIIEKIFFPSVRDDAMLRFLEIKEFQLRVDGFESWWSNSVVIKIRFLFAYFRLGAAAAGSVDTVPIIFFFSDYVTPY